MYNFTDLIARSYLEYTNKKDDNIAYFFFQEFHQVRPEARAKFIFTKERFYLKLINNIDDYIKGTAHNYHIDRSYFDNDIDINEAEEFEEFEKKRLLDHQRLLDESGVNYVVQRVDYEECTNAKQLTEALDYGLNLKDPIKIISPNKDIQADDLVLRKSKLEYLKTEAIRARDAKDIEELDVNGLLPNQVTYNSLNDSKPKRNEIVQEFIIKALEIIKPLGGIYIMDSLLDDADMKRLNNYVVELITTGNLPTNLLPFPRTSIPNQFIRKTMHLVYILIRKKYRSEFIELTHLFKQFEGTELATTDSKFSTYDGIYETIKSKITF